MWPNCRKKILEPVLVILTGLDFGWRQDRAEGYCSVSGLYGSPVSCQLPGMADSHFKRQLERPDEVHPIGGWLCCMVTAMRAVAAVMK